MGTKTFKIQTCIRGFITDAHETSLGVCKNIKGLFKMLKLWIKGR